MTLRVFSDSSGDWYPFTPTNDTGPSVVGMNDWVDKPAGKHGYLQIKGDDFVFEDGTPAKLWGVDFGISGVTKRQQSSALAAWWEKWGVNAIRNVFLFSGQGWQGLGDKNDTTKLDPKRLDDLDFFCSELRKHGVYYGFSAFWNSPLRPADRDKVLNYDEAQKVASGLEPLAPDIQDLRIAAVVNWLKHKNPYTGLTYAADAGVSYIEMRNEEDVFWYNVAPAVAACPTYRARIRRRFCDWLKAKYGSAAALRKAWGERCWGVLPGCEVDESLEKGDLNPVFGAWYFTPTGLADQQRQFGARRRLLDSAQFLYEQQSQYYARFAKAIRDTGYRGVLVGSDWQAGSGVPQLYNILTDREVGYVDRHNYFGGMGHGVVASGNQNNASMLWQPGSGLFSSSFQQVGDRPFGLSEWCSNVPNEWRAEAPAILGYYGMGLQGWDVSYESFGDVPRFTSTVQSEGGNVWNADSATQLGLYPAVARSVHRGDVKEGDVIAARRVSMDDLHSGNFNFSDVVAQAATAKEGAADVKEFKSSVPSAALAAGRVVIDFVDKTTPSLIPDLSKQIAARHIVSDTGQLDWRYPDTDGSFFTVNTDGTKALVGFAPDKEFTLGDVGIRFDNKFAVVLVTALDRGKTLADCRSALVTVVARERNTGMVYAENRGVPDVGHAPVILEPVFGSVSFGRKVARVNVLDQDGRRTGRTLPVEDGKFTIDGTRDRTPYYEVVFE